MKLAGSCAILLLSCSAAGRAADVEADKLRLLALHEELKAAHVRGDADTIMKRLADDYVRVSRGQVSHPEHGQMTRRMRDYLDHTTFAEYRDLRPPIVKVSADGTLGWVIVELQAQGLQEGPDGERVPLEFVCAWVSLFEKRDGEWVMTGDASTFRE